MRVSRFLPALALSTMLAATTGCASTPEPVSAKVQAYYSSQSSLAQTKAPAAPSVSIGADALAAGTRAVFFGDSWTKGTGATQPEQGYAYLTGQTLSLSNTVLGIGGTGYVNPGPTNTGNYAARLEGTPVDREVRLLVIQGSINDVGQGLSGYSAEVAKTLRLAAEKFPAAQIVVLGPTPALVPVSADLVTIDKQLGDAAAAKGLPYVSPVRDQWITSSNIREMLDSTQGNHPSTEGHAYLADLTVKALKALVGS